MATFNKTTPDGTIDGTNAIFTLDDEFSALELYKNGQLQTDAGEDYTLTSGTSTSTIVFTSSATPQTGDVLIAWMFNQ